MDCLLFATFNSFGNHTIIIIVILSIEDSYRVEKEIDGESVIVDIVDMAGQVSGHVCNHNKAECEHCVANCCTYNTIVL